LAVTHGQQTPDYRNQISQMPGMSPDQPAD